ncbi:hypothetical protein [Rubellimicrobium arenae]|uniref:hypothetical protein n=1 Tax=Rubellimicrobium arenae TaxID=2817372 RepID=UPI001B30DB32|nr:hypothetical protein [Rubellimicrobium arenae]
MNQRIHPSDVDQATIAQLLDGQVVVIVDEPAARPGPDDRLSWFELGVLAAAISFGWLAGASLLHGALFFWGP